MSQKRRVLALCIAFICILGCKQRRNNEGFVTSAFNLKQQVESFNILRTYDADAAAKHCELKKLGHGGASEFDLWGALRHSTLARWPERTPQLTFPELLALKFYTGEGYRLFNRAQSDGACRARFASLIETFRTGLERLPPYQGEVFSGRQMSLGEFSKLQPGYVLTSHEYVSTSKQKNISMYFIFGAYHNPALKQVMLQIRGKAGRDITELSQRSAESEVLYAPGSKFKVTSVENVTESFENKSVQYLLVRADDESTVVQTTRETIAPYQQIAQRIELGKGSEASLSGAMFLSLEAYVTKLHKEDEANQFKVKQTDGRIELDAKGEGVRCTRHGSSYACEVNYLDANRYVDEIVPFAGWNEGYFTFHRAIALGAQEFAKARNHASVMVESDVKADTATIRLSDDATLFRCDINGLDGSQDGACYFRLAKN